MSPIEAKVRCPKCHFRFFVPLDEVGRDGTTPCPNCNTPIPVKTKADAAPAVPKAPVPAAPPSPKTASAPSVAAPVAVAAPAADATPAAAQARPWWKFWAR